MNQKLYSIEYTQRVDEGTSHITYIFIYLNFEQTLEEKKVPQATNIQPLFEWVELIVGVLSVQPR